MPDKVGDIQGIRDEIEVGEIESSTFHPVEIEVWPDEPDKRE